MNISLKSKFQRHSFACSAGSHSKENRRKFEREFLNRGEKFGDMNELRNTIVDGVLFDSYEEIKQIIE